MRIVVRPADLSRDRNILINTLHQYLTSTSSQNRYDWLYRQNPHGEPRVWLALDEENGEVVGSSAAFARRVRIKGSARAGWVLGDFCIADKYRSLGPALQLQRATLQAIEQMDGAGFCYDFPSRRLAATYQRLRIPPVAQMMRLVKPLRIDAKLEKLWGSRNLAKPPVWFGNFLLKLLDLRFRRQNGVDIAIHSGECGEEFNALEGGSSSRNGIEVERSAAYLNWRYLRHPLIQHRILTARKNGELKGYLVFSCPNEHAQIAEWRVGDDPDLLAALIGELVPLLRKTGAIALNAYLLDGDSRLPNLTKIGFWPRESNPVMVYGPRCDEVLSCKWLLMYGDRDS